MWGGNSQPNIKTLITISLFCNFYLSSHRNVPAHGHKPRLQVRTPRNPALAGFSSRHSLLFPSLCLFCRGLCCGRLFSRRFLLRTLFRCGFLFCGLFCDGRLCRSFLWRIVRCGFLYRSFLAVLFATGFTVFAASPAVLLSRASSFVRSRIMLWILSTAPTLHACEIAPRDA